MEKIRGERFRGQMSRDETATDGGENGFDTLAMLMKPGL